MQSPAVKATVILVMFALLGTYLYLNNWKLYWMRDQYSDMLSGEPAIDLRFLVRGRKLAVCNILLTNSFDAKGRRQLAFCPISDKKFSALKNEINHSVILVNGNIVPERLRSQDSDFVVDLPTKRIYLVRKTDIETFAAVIAKERAHQRQVLACEGKKLCRTIRITDVTGWGPLEGPYSKTDPSEIRAGLPLGRWGLGPGTVLTIQSSKRQKELVVVYLDQFIPEQQINFEGNILAEHSVRPEGIAFHYRSGRLYPKEFILEVLLLQGENKITIRYSQWNKSTRFDPRPLAVYLTGIEFKELI